MQRKEKMTIRNFTLHEGTKAQGVCASIYNGLNDVSVLYHKTIIFNKTGNKITLRNGGWKTVSTKTLINKCFNQLGINAYLYQKKGVWIIRLNDQLDSLVEIPFVDGMVINL